MKYASFIVTYGPSYSDVTNLIATLLQQRVEVVVYDNTPNKVDANRFAEFLAEKFNDSIKVLNSEGNKGLSTAFNESVDYLMTNSAELEGILIFDQDSIVTPEVLNLLISSYEELKESGVDVGVIGGMPVDLDGKPYHYRNSKKQLERFSHVVNTSLLVPVEFVISSFSLIPISSFKRVGLFEQDYFIDLIDNEFCFRCIEKKLGVFMVLGAKFKHVVGSSRLSLFGRLIAISSPFRNYYQFRNPIFVAKKYGWFWWCFKILSLRFVQVTLSGLKERNLILRYKHVFKGILDGIKSKGGQLG